MNRREAAPLEFDLLSDSQKQAAENIARSLQSALEDLEATPESSNGVDDELENWRSSRNFFVSGEPGSGKTSVYLTLKRLLRKEEMKVEGRQYHGLRKLRGSQSRLEWLEPLDLETAAGSTNFLAAVLVRLDKAIHGDTLEKLPEVRRPGLLENDDARQKFRRLENDVVLAWDGTVPERAEHVDPEVFSQDVLRAEKARLRVNQRLRGTLDSVARSGGDTRTLYVLPVDDFYLHPASSLEFLRLLRMISVPELFILVMGDLDVVRELFYLNQLGQLVRLVGEKSVEALLFPHEQVTGRAGALTAYALSKLIPLSQRAVLEAMDQLQALEFTPKRPGTREKDDEVNDLGYLLGEVPLRVDKSNLPEPANGVFDPKNLHEFLLVRESSVERDSDSYTYSGLSVLDLPPREVVDLWLSLDKLVEQKESGESEAKESEAKESEAKLWESVLRKVTEHTLTAIELETYLGREGKDRCLEAIQGAPYDKRNFQSKALSITSRSVRERTVRLTDGLLVTVSTPATWIIRPNMDVPGKDDSRRRDVAREASINYLAPRPTAWLTVLHDLMALSGDRLEGDPATPLPFELRWVLVSDDSKDPKHERSWLTPHWLTFRQCDLLAFRWNKVLGKNEMFNSEQEDARLTWLAYQWLNVVTETLIGNWSPDPKIQESGIGDEQWQKLLKDTDVLLAQVTGRGPVGGHQRVVRGWLLRLEIFLSDEFAIPSLVRDRLRCEPLKGFWEREYEVITSIRRSELKP